MTSTLCQYLLLSLFTLKNLKLLFFYIYRSKCIKMLKGKVGTFQNYFKKPKPRLFK